MDTIVILGAGNIGRAAYKILKTFCFNPNKNPQTIADSIERFYVADNVFFNYRVEIWDKEKTTDDVKVVDINSLTPEEFSDSLRASNAKCIINAMPFFMNEKIAISALKANCMYVDFTEDDEMAEKVQNIYSASKLTCAVKCGLAPGFINYLGHDLAKRIDHAEKLMISVGALPRSVSFTDPSTNYNLSWSVDGLVNEYIRPCNVRMAGRELKVSPLTHFENVLIDGQMYEAMLTSGGIGSLVKELKRIPNVYYKTLRYPGHYEYVKNAVARHRGDFEAIKKEFLSKFPFNSDDVIVVYAECVGRNTDGSLKKEVFSTKFVGANGLSAIQTTTAGGALTVLELILKNQLQGIINHKDVPFGLFLNTEMYQRTYFRQTT